MIFRACQFEYVFPRPALVMGIVNVTPDSFSDGGRFPAAEDAVAQGLELAGQGAALLDVGGESTRPGAAPVPEAEELRRVLPVIEKLASALGEINAARERAGGEPVLISIDTMKPAVARAALRAGAQIVNDVGARPAAEWPLPSATDRAMWRVVAESGAGYVCMHAQGTPQTMQRNPVYADVVAAVNDFFAARLAQLQAAGVAVEQVALDPGFGFGKTAEHNLQLLAGWRSFTKWRRPLLLGVSRKAFLGAAAGAAVDERLPASLAGVALALTGGGMEIARVHDVAGTVQAVRMVEAVLSRKKHERI